MSAARILLVEDEDSLRALLAKYLTRLQYAVDSVASAEEALRLLDGGRPDEPYALLLVDLTLPGMPGDEFARRALASYPLVRVLLSSGYPYELSALPEAFRRRAAFLQKPYLPRQLAERMTRLLEAGPAT